MEFKKNLFGYVDDVLYIYFPSFNGSLVKVNVEEHENDIFVNCTLDDVPVLYRYSKSKYSVEEAVLDACKKIY